MHLHERDAVGISLFHVLKHKKSKAYSLDMPWIGKFPKKFYRFDKIAIDILFKV